MTYYPVFQVGSDDVQPYLTEIDIIVLCVIFTVWIASVIIIAILVKVDL